mmetsp:Transcript_81052/g.216442  ORF Transcript_81052/g.216442 Transcript_81052/m.216442 type:complete len:300 (+) Transcript_81052:2892-3791(+)
MTDRRQAQANTPLLLLMENCERHAVHFDPTPMVPGVWNYRVDPHQQAALVVLQPQHRPRSTWSVAQSCCAALTRRAGQSRGTKLSSHLRPTRCADGLRLWTVASAATLPLMRYSKLDHCCARAAVAQSQLEPRNRTGLRCRRSRHRVTAPQHQQPANTPADAAAEAAQAAARRPPLESPVQAAPRTLRGLQKPVDHLQDRLAIQKPSCLTYDWMLLAGGRRCADTRRLRQVRPPHSQLCTRWSSGSCCAAAPLHHGPTQYCPAHCRQLDRKHTHGQAKVRRVKHPRPRLFGLRAPGLSQ